MNAPAVSRLTTSSDASWGLSGLDGIEESRRDTVLWLFSGHTALFEVRGFYHHLRETCSATAAQIYTTKHTLSTMRRHMYDC
jgi:helicase